MAKKDYIEQNDLAFGLQLNTFKANIGSYPGFGITPAQITAQAADADYFNFLVQCQSILQNDAKATTSWRNAVRNGNSSATPVALTPLPPAVPPVPAGVEPRFRALVQQIKSHPAYNVAIGTALGVEGASAVAPDLNTLQPSISAQVTAAGVVIDWSFGGYAAYLDALEIQVDRGDGKGFVTLTNDPTPGYIDTTPFPATPTKWTYRDIYTVNDQRVGNWSPTVSVMVG